MLLNQSLQTCQFLVIDFSSVQQVADRIGQAPFEEPVDQVVGHATRHRLGTHDGPIDEYLPAKYTLSWILYSIVGRDIMNLLTVLIVVLFWVAVIGARRSKGQADGKDGDGGGGQV